jgi:hypothetical protein
MPDAASQVPLRARKRRMLLAGLAVIGVGALALTVLFLIMSVWGYFLAEGIGRSLDAALDPNGKGVVVTSCRPSSFGGIEIRGSAHNSTPNRSTFIIGLVVSDRSGSHVANVDAVANHVEPGKTAPWKAATSTKFKAGATCNLSSVLRAPF